MKDQATNIEEAKAIQEQQKASVEMIVKQMKIAIPIKSLIKNLVR